MELFAFRLLSEDQASALFGYFQIYKMPIRYILKVQKDDQERILIPGEKIYIFKGMNELLYKTWDGMEATISCQKEFITADGFRGTFYITEHHDDVNVIFQKIANPTAGITDDTCVDSAWYAPERDYIAFEPPTGVTEAIQRFTEGNDANVFRAK